MKTFKEFSAHFSDYVRRIQMQPRIRDVVRERLAAYADMHAMTGTITRVGRERFTFFESLNFQLFRAGFALLIVAVSAGSVAYASGGALPGDTLYPVKVGVIEPVESALLLDAKSRATWNAILAERRLSEAASLASAGTLTESTRAELESRFALHAERSGKAAGEVRAKGDIAVALSMQSDLEARLNAHADLFSYLSMSEEKQEEKKFHLAIARARDQVAAERQETETEVAARTLAYGDAQINATESATDEVARTALSGGDDAAPAIDARIIAARTALSSARESLSRDERGIAFVSAQAAARLTHEASILAKNRSLIAFAPSAPAATEAAEPAKAKDTAKKPAAPSGGSVILLKVPGLEVPTTTPEATSTNEVEEAPAKKKKLPRAETPSPESQDDEESDDSGSQTSSTPIRDTVRNVRSVLGL